MNFKDQVAVVTGGGNGIGRGVALAFAEHGAAVGILDIDLRGAQETRKLILKKGGSALAIQTDVGDERSVASAFQASKQSLGDATLLVNVAGIEFYKPFLEIESAAWDRNIAVNLKSVYLCCRQAIPQMIRAGGGAIVNTSSVQAIATTGQTSAYAAAKAGILTLTKDLARDYGPHNIRVNAICPGCIESPMMDRSLARLTRMGARKVETRIRNAIPLKRIGTPHDIANVVLFLCSPQAAYVTGTSVIVDGGLMAKIPLPEGD